MQLFGEPSGLLKTLRPAQALRKIRQRSYEPERLIVFEALEIALCYQAVVSVFGGLWHPLSRYATTAKATALVSN